MTVITSPLPAAIDSNPPGVRVAADLSYVSPILSNSLENAERYSPAVERILVETARRDSVVIRTIDEGPHIGPAERGVIFRAFTPPIGGPRRGSGARPAASKRLVEAHGRRIWSQQSAAGDTEFGFTLPTATEGGRDGQ